MSKMSKGKDPNVTLSNASTANVVGSATATPTMSMPGSAIELAPPDIGDARLEEVTAMAAKVAAARAEALINEKFSAANQAQALTSRMLTDATQMLEKATLMLGTITESLRASAEMQERLDSGLRASAEMQERLDSGLSTSSAMQKSLEADVANIKGNAVAALSIFVSFFAFITVSINVFSKAGSIISASALILVFWCLLVGFNIVIGWQFNTLRNSGIAWFLLLLVSCLSVIAVVGMYYFSPDALTVTKPVLATP